MGTPIEFAGKTHVFTPPKDSDGVPDDRIGALPAYSNGQHIVSCWIFSKEELLEIIRTGKVFVAVLSKTTLYPMFLGSENSVREQIADAGVWKR